MRGSRIGITLLALAALAIASPGDAIAESYTHEKLALEGDPVPDLGGVYGSDFLTLDLNDVGDVGFFGPVVGGSANFGAFVTSGGTAAALAAIGDPAPDSGTFLFFGGFAFLNDAGALAFFAYTTDGITGTPGMFLLGGPDRAVTRPGDTAPAPPATDYVASPVLWNFHALAQDGSVVFASDLTDVGVTTGLFRDSAGVDSAVSLVGDVAPGTGGGSYAGFDSPSASEAGPVVFAAGVSGGSVAKGLFLDTSGTDSLLVLDGAAAPDTGGGTISDFLYPLVNDAGQATFLSNVVGGTATGGVFLATVSSLDAVAVEGGAAPGTGGGSYTSIASFAPIDAAGRVAISAGIGGGSVSAGVFLFDSATGMTEPVVLAGEEAPDSGGATFAAFSFLSLNDDGQIAYQADLSDGRRGLFLASPVAAAANVPAVPAPALALLAASLLAGGAVSTRYLRGAP